MIPGKLRKYEDRIVRQVCLVLLCCGMAVLLLMIAFLVKESSLFNNFGIPLTDFLFRQPWAPLATPPTFGIHHAWVSTFIVSGIALAIAVPFGVGMGLFIAELAPDYIRKILQPGLELLAGVPAVVYGFFGYITLVRNFEGWFDMPAGECLLIAGVVLSVMVLPFIASTAAETFQGIALDLKDAALTLGVTHLYLTRRVLFKKALPGLFAAVALGLARALGETLAVLMLAGNSVALPRSLFDRGQPITALIATELGETGLMSQKYKAIYASGFFLLAFVIAINLVVWSIKRRSLRHVHV